jgi:pimeloyl-ACP methyl ester carboxylesterase
MGAHTILRLALEQPERVAALVVITPAYDPDEFGDADSLARWDALAEGLRSGGVDGFVEAYGDPGVPEAWRETVFRVIRQRLAAHEHLDAVADAIQATPRSRPFPEIESLAAIAVPTVVVADRDEADPGHPLAIGEAYGAAIPGARLLVEEPGKSPLAWQGGQLSRVIAELAAASSS